MRYKFDKKSNIFNIARFLKYCNTIAKHSKLHQIFNKRSELIQHISYVIFIIYNKIYTKD